VHQQKRVADPDILHLQTGAKATSGHEPPQGGPINKYLCFFLELLHWRVIFRSRLQLFFAPGSIGQRGNISAS